MKTEIVAWWGAILATIVLFWDVYKWRAAGPKLRVSVQSGMESINMLQYDGKTLILVNVSNYGDRPTTFTNLGYLYFTNLWNRIRRRPDKAAIIPNPSDVHPLPHELKQGSLWSGIAIQDDQVTKWAKEGRLYCVLYHSHSERPIYRRVVAHERSNA
ncbi:MAG: hypothetical protein HY017_02085 [Betaproteobacteria bacterium]|nr:hypothetical protein [Betaproteobacteria bacterium]